MSLHLVSRVSIRQRLLVALVCGLAILGGQAALAFGTVQANRAAAAWVNHTFEVLTVAGSV